MVVGDDFELSLSDGVCGLLAHLSAVHIPLRLQQRLHNVLRATDRTDTQFGLRRILSRMKISKNTNNLCSTYAHMSLTLPADWDNHRIVFDLFKLALVLESLQHHLPSLEALHALGDGQNS